MQRLAERTIVVTGGASGLGQGDVIAFAAEGARVVVGDVRRESRCTSAGSRRTPLIAEGGRHRAGSFGATSRALPSLDRIVKASTRRSAAAGSL